MVKPWWLADSRPDFAKTAPEHRTCWHLRYRLTCQQYEDLLARSRGRCEICELPAPENRFGKLYIDHDPNQGIWAVRGLLCETCNSTVRFPWKIGADRYLANAWYLGIVAAGVPLGVPPEPPLGSEVTDHAGRLWRRESEGWVTAQPRGLPIRALAWRDMIHRFGPHNLSAA